MSRSTLNIDKELYKMIKEYCDDNHYKISAWAGRVLVNEVTKDKNKNK